MTETELADVMAQSAGGETGTAAAAFRRHPAQAWVNGAYGWKTGHAQEVSGFIQEIVKVPPSEAGLHKVIALTENHLHALSHLPDAADLATSAAVCWWNRRQAGDPQLMRDYLTCWPPTPTEAVSPKPPYKPPVWMGWTARRLTARAA